MVVDTQQAGCYDDAQQITCPDPGEPFHGQDAQYHGVACAYVGNGDGTVTDLNTGLTWQQTPALYDKSTHAEAVAGAPASTSPATTTGACPRSRSSTP
jgi:hypothetical protein